MSVGEYRNVLYQFSKDIDWQNERERIIFICQGFLPDGFADHIVDVISLLNKLVEKNLLGIDRLNVLKELIKGIRNWDLLRLVEQFEIKRKDYKQLLEQISRTLDECNELEQLVSICRRENLIAHEREEHIVNVNGLFKELEEHNNLGIENLGILKSFATAVEKPDLCRLVEEFEQKRKQDEDSERERKEWEDCRRRARAQAASVLAGGINIGERMIGVVTPHCTFRNLTGGAVVVTTWMVLRRSPSMEAFVNAFKEAVLPFGNFLRAISEGSTRFIIQAESISALDALWQSYKDETLQTDLQEFLVTEEMKELAGGEVTLTVHIDEDEYVNAKFDLLKTERSETEEIKLQEQRGLRDRANSDSGLLKERKMTTDNTKDPSPEKEFLPFDRKVRIQEYVENLPETYSEITQPSDSGVGTWSSAPSEYEFDNGEGGGHHEESSLTYMHLYSQAQIHYRDRIERLDQVDGFIKDAIESLRSLRDAYSFSERAFHDVEEEMELFRITLETLREKEKERMNAAVTEVSLPDTVEQALLSASCDAKEIVHQLKEKLRLDEDVLERPDPDTKKIIRSLAQKARDLKRIDVLRHLREITPAGTTGPLLPECLRLQNLPFTTRREITFGLSGYDKWKEIAEGLGLTPQEIRFLDQRTRNPMEAALSFISQEGFSSDAYISSSLVRSWW